MFTVEDSIFPNTWIQFSNPELNYYKKSQLVTFTSAMLNVRKQGHYKYFSELPLKHLTK